MENFAEFSLCIIPLFKLLGKHIVYTIGLAVATHPDCELFVPLGRISLFERLFWIVCYYYSGTLFISFSFSLFNTI